MEVEYKCVRVGQQVVQGESKGWFTTRCSTQRIRHNASWDGTEVYLSVVYGTQHNAQIDLSSIPVSLVLRRKGYARDAGPASYCEPVKCE